MQCIRGMLSQTYKNLTHVVMFIGIDDSLIKRTEEEFLNEIKDKKLIIFNVKENKHQYDNAVNCVDYALANMTEMPDIICKVDDDDWYFKSYIEEVVSVYDKTMFDLCGQTNCDVYKNKKESNITTLINPCPGNSMAFSFNFWQEIKRNVNHPMKSCKFEDHIWHNYIAVDPYKTTPRPNNGNLVYFIHNSNTSTCL